MKAQAVCNIISQLQDAGLAISLKEGGLLEVAPASFLTADLRALIRESKPLLIDWLNAANEPQVFLEPPKSPMDWHELDAAYLAHHFNCKSCIAAGRGGRYGQRCGVGAALWRAYSEHDTDIALHQAKNQPDASDLNS